RCSKWTPTACVGTRTKRLGCGSRSSGITRNFGVGETGLVGRSGSRGAVAAWAVGSVCIGRFFQANARLLALISPLREMKQDSIVRWFYLPCPDQTLTP